MPSLSDTKVRGAKPRERPYKLFDERGLYLLVTPTGGRPWRVQKPGAKGGEIISPGAFSGGPPERAPAKSDQAGRPLPGGINPPPRRPAQSAGPLQTFS